MIKYVFLSILLLVSVPITFAQTNEVIFCDKVSEDNPIFLTTDKENYDNGDIISVSGCLAPNAQTKGVNLNIYDPKGNMISKIIFVPSGGFFSEEFVIDEDFAIDGTYTVEVDSAGLYQATKTIVVPEFGPMILLVLSIGMIVPMIMLRNKFKFF